MDEFVPMARNVGEMKKWEYGSNGYKKALKKVGPALDLHYSRNSHHPEHNKDPQFGTYTVSDMNLWDIVEMYCDWKAAIRNNPNGSMRQSLRVARSKYFMDETTETWVAYWSGP